MRTIEKTNNKRNIHALPLAWISHENKLVTKGLNKSKDHAIWNNNRLLVLVTVTINTIFAHNTRIRNRPKIHLKPFIKNAVKRTCFVAIWKGAIEIYSKKMRRMSNLQHYVLMQLYDLLIIRMTTWISRDFICYFYISKLDAFQDKQNV